MISLGCDASTTTCGYSFTENHKILDAGFIDISKFDTIKEKSFNIIKLIESKNIKFDRINLEAAVSGFGFGKTSQQTIIKLVRFNSVFCYILEEHFKVPVTLVNAMTARKQLFGKARIKGIKPKEFVKENIEKMFDIKPWMVLNTRGDPDKRMDDIRDAIVISLFDPQ